MYLSPILLIVIAAVGFAYAINNLYLRLLHAKKAKSLNCKDVLSDTRGGWTGIPMAILLTKAVNELKLPGFIQNQFESLSAKHGWLVTTFHLRAGLFRDVIFTSEPQNVRAILATQFEDFSIGETRKKAFAPLFGVGLLTTEGKKWEHSRALGRRQFSRAHVSNVQIEETHVQSLMTVLARAIEDDGWTSLVDIQPLFFRLTLDSASEFLFSESVNCQLQTESSTLGTEEEIALASAVDEVQFTTAKGIRLGDKYWVAFNKRFYKQVDIIHSFVDRFVQQALSSDGKTDENPASYLHSIIKETRDPAELRSEIMTLLFGGRDTTASALSWFFFTMAKHPKVYQHLRDTVLDEFGSYSNPKTITYESMKACRYLQWCINETLRLHTIAPVISRAASRDTTLPIGGGPDGTSPVYLKKGHPVSLALGVMHRRKDLWGDDAEEFRPERWEDRKVSWSYAAFSGGPRICIGQQFALTEVAYVVIRMLQRIDAIDGSEVGDASHRVGLTSAPGHGVKIRLHFVE